jgi:hypothetical protein
VSSRSQPGGQIDCYSVQAPVIAVYNRNTPAIYEVIAFTFDVYNTPVNVPLRVVNSTSKSNEKVDATAPTWLKYFEKVVLYNVKKTVGNVPVKVSEIDSVFQPLCRTAYIVFRIVGTLGVRAVIKPIMITSSYDQVLQYVSAVVTGGSRSRATATSYYVAQAPVNFFMSPDSVTSYMYTTLGE